jgi:hypothetical protein
MTSGRKSNNLAGTTMRWDSIVDRITKVFLRAQAGIEVGTALSWESPPGAPSKTAAFPRETDRT